MRARARAARRRGGSLLRLRSPAVIRAKRRAGAYARGFGFSAAAYLVSTLPPRTLALYLYYTAARPPLLSLYAISIPRCLPKKVGSVYLTNSFSCARAWDGRTGQRVACLAQKTDVAMGGLSGALQASLPRLLSPCLALSLPPWFLTLWFDNAFRARWFAVAVLYLCCVGSRGLCVHIPSHAAPPR